MCSSGICGGGGGDGGCISNFIIWKQHSFITHSFIVHGLHFSSFETERKTKRKSSVLALLCYHHHYHCYCYCHNGVLSIHCRFHQISMYVCMNAHSYIVLVCNVLLYNSSTKSEKIYTYLCSYFVYLVLVLCCCFIYIYISVIRCCKKKS